VLVLIAVLAPLVYLNFLRDAEMSPEEFLDAGGDNGNGPVVAVLGASTVHGIGSADFVSVLRQRMGGDGYQFVNAGINGDTSADLLERADEIAAVKPDAVAVLVGSNNVRSIDTLEPALGDYRRDLGELARTLTDRTGTDLAFYSLQPLGEDLDDAGNERVTAFNGAIADVARKYDAAYLPLGETLADTIRSRGGSTPSGFSFAAAATAGFEHYYLGRGWNEIGESNGYTVLIDGLHLNDRGAKTAADLGEDWLREVDPG
ncbi:MAG: SGNH/GDSL hydrolase family protein, partial [Stackebrandtia sp.]